MRIRIGLLALCVCGVLSACGSQGDPGDSPYRLGQAVGISETETVCTVDGREIQGWQYLYWLRQALARNADANAAREEALMDAALYAAVEDLASQYGLTVSEEEIAERWEAQSRAGLDRSREETFLRTELLYEKLRGACEPGGALWPGEETIEAMARERGIVRIDRILLPAGEDRTAAKRRAEECFVRLNSAEDQGELFTALARENGDAAGPRNLTEAGFNEELSKAAGALNIGQLSGILETEEGFSILRRLPPEREPLLDAWLDETLQRKARSAEIRLSDAARSLDPAALAGVLSGS